LVLAALMLLGALGSGAGVLAQSAPWRIVQSSDGTLYVLKDGARFALVGEPIDDDELAAYADGGTNGTSILLSAIAAPATIAAQPVADAARTAEAPQPEVAEAAAAQQPPAQPEARVAPSTNCAAVPTGGKRSAVCAATPQPAPPAAADGPRFLSIQGASPGRSASVTVQAAPGAGCSIGFITPEGTRSAAAGLGPQTVGGAGTVTWSFVIGSTTQNGSGTISVGCNGQTISSPIQIGVLK